MHLTVFQLPLFFRLLFTAPSQTRVPLLLTGQLQNLLVSGKEPDGCILNDEVGSALVLVVPL